MLALRARQSRPPLGAGAGQSYRHPAAFKVAQLPPTHPLRPSAEPAVPARGAPPVARWAPPAPGGVGVLYRRRFVMAIRYKVRRKGRCVGCRAPLPRSGGPWGVSLCQGCFALAVRLFLAQRPQGVAP